VWTVTLNLTAAEIKFGEQDDDWKVNYGDKGADGILDFNSDNIKFHPLELLSVRFKFSRNYKYTLTKTSIF
jgi:hypothetical protein